MRIVEKGHFHESQKFVGAATRSHCAPLCSIEGSKMTVVILVCTPEKNITLFKQNWWEQTTHWKKTVYIFHQHLERMKYLRKDTKISKIVLFKHYEMQTWNNYKNHKSNKLKFFKWTTNDK